MNSELDRLRKREEEEEEYGEIKTATASHSPPARLFGVRLKVQAVPLGARRPVVDSFGIAKAFERLFAQQVVIMVIAAQV